MTRPYWFAHAVPPSGWRMRLVPICWQGWAALVALVGSSLYGVIAGSVALTGGGDMPVLEARLHIAFGVMSAAMLAFILWTKTDHSTFLHAERDNHA